MTFTKNHPGAAVEAASLQWLAAANAVPVVPVKSLVGDRIILEKLATVSPTRTAARVFGRRLVALHDAGAPAFGSPPTDWDGPGFIGLAPLSFAATTTWGQFYAQHRVLPYTARLAPRDRAIIDALGDRLITGDFDDPAPPARIHGDLWAGNVLFTANGVTLIDPAAHGGHRITDLAMLALFGAPFLDDILDAYAESSEHLPTDWRTLIPLHQIHPLLVHDVLFGGSYGTDAVQAARKYL